MTVMLFRCVTSTLSIVIFAWRWHEWVYVMKSLPVMKIDYVVSNLYLIILGTLGIACCISSIVSFKDSNLFGYGMVISSLLLAGRVSNPVRRRHKNVLRLFVEVKSSSDQ